MKKSALSLAVLAAMFGLSSCDKELVPAEDINNNNKSYVIDASTEDSRTKTSISGNDTEGYQVLWSDNDSFFAYKYNEVTGKYMKVKGPFTLISGAGTTKGTFERKDGNLETGVYQVLYLPDYYTTTFSTLQEEYLAKNQTYAEGIIPSLPMCANFLSESLPIQFKNIGGIIRLTVKGTATVKSIEVNATELATPITLSCGDGAKLTSEGTVFHIAMPEKTYKGVVITLTDTNNKTCTKTFKGTAGLEIERSMITKASFTASGFNYNEGDKVEFGGHEGIVVDIDGTLVAVATMNVGAKSVNGSNCLGTKMTYYAACKAWSGWRLPTVKELTAFCDPGYDGVCGNTEGAAGCTGAMMWDFDENEEIDLYLPLNDYEITVNGYYPCDKYWTEPADNDGKYFYFVPEIDWEGGYGNTYYPIACDEGRAYKEETAPTEPYLVRLFHDLP